LTVWRDDFLAESDNDERILKVGQHSATLIRARVKRRLFNSRWSFLSHHLYTLAPETADLDYITEHPGPCDMGVDNGSFWQWHLVSNEHCPTPLWCGHC